MRKISNAYSNDFKPMLLDVNFNTNLFSPGDLWWISANWQNTGKDPADSNYRCLIELDTCYQRVVDNVFTDYTFYAQTNPGFDGLGFGETVGMSFKWNIGFGWNGTHRVMLSLVDENGNKMPFIGKGGETVYRQHVGDIESSWTWGKAMINLIRQPYFERFNCSIEKIEKDGRDSVVIGGGDFRITLDKKEPRIITVTTPNKAYSQPEFSVTYCFREYSSDTVYYMGDGDVSTQINFSQEGSDSAVYSYIVSLKGKKVVEFDLRYGVCGRTLKIERENVKEASGYEFLTLTIPSVFSMSDEGTKIVDLWNCGRLIDVAKARPMAFSREYDIRNALGIYSDLDTFVYEGESLDDRMIIAIGDDGGKHRATVGATIMHRARGFGKVRSIEAPASNIVLDYVPEEYGKPDWMTVCKFLRRGLTPINKHIHNSTMHMLCYCAYGPEPHPKFVTPDAPYEITRHMDGYKFSELPTLLSEINNLSDGYRTSMIVYGYYQQDDGNYLGDFNTYKPDLKRAGKTEEIAELIRTSKEKYNIVLTLYENYDDYYRNSDFIDEKYIAMDKYGNPNKGWIWADGLSHIMGFRKYYESGEMVKRIKKMTKVYGVRDTTYVDVISSEVCRYDFDPECPATAQTLLEYRRKFIEEYNKCGVDVESEQMVHPFVGHQGWAMHIHLSGDQLFDASETIPAMPVIYHGVIGYGCLYNQEGPQQILSKLKYCGNVAYEFSPKFRFPWVEHAYLYDMPLKLLQDETLENCHTDGDTEVYEYSNGGKITVNVKDLKYTIIHRGVVYAKDFTCLVPGVKENTCLAFNKEGGEMVYALPACFKAEDTIKCVELTIDGEGETIPTTVKDGNLVLNLKAMTPYRVFKA